MNQKLNKDLFGRVAASIDTPDFEGNMGYPLGTTCWYVFAAVAGLRKWICADTPSLAICRAALWIIEETNERGIDIRQAVPL